MQLFAHISGIQLGINATITEAAKRIQDQGIKLVLVCNESGRLLGTVTDGDIRRAVSNEIDMHLSITNVMNKNPIVYRGKCKETIRSIMKRNVIKHLPVVDENNCVIQLYVLESDTCIKKIENPVLLMAGGVGKRLKPTTDLVPKPLLPIRGKPVLQRIIESLKSEGFYHFYISVNYLGYMIEEYFQDGSEWDIKIDYLREKEPLGTAGCLSLIKQLSKPIFVMNGDVLTQKKFKPIIDSFDDTKYMAKIGLKNYSYTVPFGCVTIQNDKIVQLLEKPTKQFLVTAGCYILSSRILKYVENHAFDMPDFLNQLMQSKHHIGYFQIDEDWIDIGRKDDLQRANEFLEEEMLLA